MRAVVDTNVSVSALVSPAASPRRILEAWEADRFEWLVSQPLLDELAQVLARPRILRRITQGPSAAGRLMMDLRSRAEVVAPDIVLDVLADEADNRVLEAAVAGGADVIVTGDAALLALGDFRGVRVVAPAQFLAELDAR